jgi:hypothetical protein
MSLTLGNGMNPTGVGAFIGVNPPSYASLPGKLFHGSQMDLPSMFMPTGEWYDFSTSIVWNVMLLEGADFLTKRILPIRQSGDEEPLTVQWTETKLEAPLLAENPEWTTAPLTSFQRTKHAIAFKRNGIQIEMEEGAARSKQGEALFTMYMGQALKAMRDTLNAQALVGLVEASNADDRRRIRLEKFKGGTIYDILKTNIALFGCLQKCESPLKTVEVVVSTEMALMGGAFDSLIVHSSARGFVETNPDMTDYSKAGPAGPELLRSDFHAPATSSNFPGIGSSIQVHALPPGYRIKELSGFLDILTHDVQIGEFYVFEDYIPWDSPRWSSSMQTIGIFNEEKDMYSNIKLITAIEKSGTFDSDGKLVDLDNLRYQADPTLDREDMFTDANGDTVRLFGDIHSKHLSVEHRKAWAHAALAQMNHHKSGAKSVETQIGELLTELQKLANQDGVQNYYTAAIQNIANQLIVDLWRCFGSSVLISDVVPSKIPTFIRNIFLPQFLPAFGVPESKKSDVDLKITGAFFSEISGDADVNTSDEIMQKLIKQYAMRIVTDAKSYPKKDTGDDLSKVDSDYEKMSRKKGAELSQIYSAAWGKFQKLKGKAGAATSAYTLDPDYLFSPKQVRKLYETLAAKADLDKLYDGITHIPGDPDFPFMPMTLERMKELFGAAELHSTLKEVPIASAFHQNIPLVHELVLQAAHSSNLASEHKYSEHIEHHSHLQRRMNANLEELLQTASIGRRQHPSEFKASKFDNAVLVSLTSHEYGKQMDELFAICSPAERVIALLFNTCRVNMDTLKRFAACNFPLPFGALLLRPHMQYKAGGALACMSGGKTGYTAVKRPVWMDGSDPNSMSRGLHMAVYSVPVILYPHNVYQIPAVLLTEYTSGHSDGWIDFNDFKPKLDRNESLYSVIIPISKTQDLPFALSITGKITDDATIAAMAPSPEPPFPQAYRFVRTTGTWQRYLYSKQDAENGAVPQNIICIRGNTVIRDVDGTMALRRGQGHLGDTSVPGAKEVRSGRGRYPSRNNYKFI